MAPITMTPTKDIGQLDREVVESLGNGDRGALAEIYRRHSGPVYGLAQRLTRNRALAEEVSQEVFLRLWNHPERFDASRGSLRTYLLTQTHGRAIDLIRSESARRIREDKEIPMLDSPTRTLDEHVIDLTTAEAVRNAVAELGDDERMAIELAYFGGHSYREVAVLLGQPEGTVKSRIRSGLHRLGATLNEFE